MLQLRIKAKRSITSFHHFSPLYNSFAVFCEKNIERSLPDFFYKNRRKLAELQRIDHMQRVRNFLASLFRRYKSSHLPMDSYQLFAYQSLRRRVLVIHNQLETAASRRR